MGLSSELSCEAGSFSGHLNPHKYFHSEVLRLYFPTLGPWVVQSVSLPSCSSWFIRRQMWDHLVFQPPPCHEFSPLWLPGSAPPTGLDECFFFNTLVVGLPYSSIFWQFWYFLFLNFLSFFWLYEEAKCIYVCLHLGQKSTTCSFHFTCHKHLRR